MWQIICLALLKTLTAQWRSGDRTSNCHLQRGTANKLACCSD